MHLLLVLRVRNKKFAHIFEGNNITIQPRRSISPERHLDFRLQPAAGLASNSRVAPTCRMDSASALRSRSSCCCIIFHCFRLVSHTSTQINYSGLQKKIDHVLGSKQSLPNSIELYRLARPRARWYQLRGLPLVGSECVCPQCNSPFVITRGSDIPWTFPFVTQDLKSSQETSRVTNELPDKMYPTILCTVKSPKDTTTAVQAAAIPSRPRLTWSLPHPDPNVFL